MTFEEFTAKWNGKLLDYDGAFGGQCVDVYRQYCKEVFAVPQSPPVVGAADIWESYLSEYFERIGNTPDGVPVKGDIIIWSKFAGGGFGHVAIFSSGDTNNFVSFDENWPVGSVCHFQPHNYTNVLGWLRPKQVASPTPTEFTFTDQTKVPLGEPWGEIELQAVRSMLKDALAGLTVAQGSIVELEAKIDEFESNPPTSDPRIEQVKSIIYGKGWWWTRINDLRKLLPQ